MFSKLSLEMRDQIKIYDIFKDLRDFTISIIVKSFHDGLGAI